MKKYFFIILLSVVFAQTVNCEDGKKSSKDKEAYVIKNDIECKVTPIKDQAKTGTCWCFGTVSFMESELLRMGRGEFDLSEMYFVKNAYTQKAERYYRLHGDCNFSPGGQMHDVTKLMREYGFMPEYAYSGMTEGVKEHNHKELVRLLEDMLNSFVRNEYHSPRWKEAYNSVLNVYLGSVPSEFVYNGKTYTPRSFNNEVLKLNPDDYVEITSYEHHPFYEQFSLEVQDNWNHGMYYNVPLDEFEAIMDSALVKGYTFAWDGDMSNHDFSQKKGYAVTPVKDWEDKTEEEKDVKITSPEAEREISQQERQKAFDDYTTVDDHVMHVTGLAHDQNGTKYYLTKNSAGITGKYNGFLYMSRSYVRMNTLAILVHKDAIPLSIARKMGLK